MSELMERHLRVGWHLCWEQQIYRIVAFDRQTLTLQTVHLATQEAVQLDLKELLSAESTVIFAPTWQHLQAQLMQAAAALTPTAVTISEGLRERANQIVSVIDQVERLLAERQKMAVRQGEPFRRSTALAGVLNQLEIPLARSTFYKYQKLYRAHQGRREAIALALHRSTFHQSQFTTAQLHFVDTLILRYYARNRPIRPSTLYRLAQSVLQHTQQHWIEPTRCPTAIPTLLVDELLDPSLPIQGLLTHPEKAPLLVTLQLPSRSWFYTYLRWYEHLPEQGEAVITARYGATTWESQYKVFDTFLNHAAAPLQYVFADHWLLDVFTVDEATRSQPERLWLTVLIDAYSRSIVGTALLYEAPGILSIQQALHHAIWPKPVQDANPTLNWPCFGIPQQLYLDNAWGHHSHSLEELSRAISQNGRYPSIDLVFRPPYKGRYGALIERFFGNLSAQVKELLPGAIPGSGANHKRSAATRACLLYRDIENILTHLILTYQHTPHSELEGLTPNEKWLAGTLDSLPLVPAQTPALTRLFWRLSPETRTLSPKGISAFGLHYWSPELAGLEQVGRDGKRVEYHFRFHPSDISHLALFQHGTWVGDIYAKELRQPDGSYPVLSLAERQLAHIIAKRQRVAPQDWLRFIHDIDTLTRTRLAEKRRANRMVVPDTAPLPAQPAASVPDLETVVHEDYTRLLAAFVTDPSAENPS